MSRRRLIVPDDIRKDVRQYVIFDEQEVVNGILRIIVVCPVCRKKRHVSVYAVRYSKDTFTAVCAGCNKPRGKSAIPLVEGDIREDVKQYIDLNSQKFRRVSTNGKPQKYNALYVLVTCKRCNKQRWIRCTTVRYKRETFTTLCSGCANAAENNPRWAGGKHIDAGNGYVKIRVFETDSYYDIIKSMVRCDNTILEHRLVMALDLQRALERWEHVHHINGKKSDNRIENLRLVTPEKHRAITDMQVEIKHLRLENKRIRQENEELKELLSEYNEL